MQLLLWDLGVNVVGDRPVDEQNLTRRTTRVSFTRTPKTRTSLLSYDSSRFLNIGVGVIETPLVPVSMQLPFSVPFDCPLLAALSLQSPGPYT